MEEYKTVSNGVKILTTPTDEWIRQNQPQLDPPIVDEEVDEEKIWMAEAIIEMSNEINILKEALENGA